MNGHTNGSVLTEDPEEEEIYDDREDAPLSRGMRVSPRVLIGMFAAVLIVTVIMVFAIRSVLNRPTFTTTATTGSDSDFPDLGTVQGGTSSYLPSVPNVAPTSSPQAPHPHVQRRKHGASGSRAQMGDLADSNDDDDQQDGDSDSSGRQRGQEHQAPAPPAIVETAAERIKRLQIEAQIAEQRQADEALSAPIAPASTTRGYTWSDRFHDPTPAPASAGNSQMSKYTLDPPAAHFIRAGSRLRVELTDGVRAGTAAGHTGGLVWGRLVEDVKDQDNVTVLIPKSTKDRETRVRFTFSSPNSGDRELYMTCDRIELPDHRMIVLRDADGHGLPVGDADGDTTVSARTDDHHGEVIRVALSSAALSAIPVALTGQPTSLLTAANPAQAAAGNLAGTINSTAARYNQQALSVPPTMYVEAHRVVLVHVDDPIPLDPFPLGSGN